MRLSWVCAIVLLLVGFGVAPLPVAADEEVAIRDLFPFGVRELGRPARAPAADEARARAVRAGLGWLAAHQAPNGGWEAANLGWCRGKATEKDLEGKGKALYDVGVTGMTVSAFLSAGHTTQEADPYSRAIERALTYLKNVQDKEGCVSLQNCQHYLYNHAFGALALVEAFGVTGDETLIAPAQNALAFSAYARNPGAAWRYGVRPGDNDTSLTGCMAMAFHAADLVNHAAEAAGRQAPLPFDREVFPGIRTWLDRMTDELGRTGYIQQGGMPARPQEQIDAFPNDRSESCTAIGVLLRQIAPGGDPKREADLVERGTAPLGAIRPRWDLEGGYIDFYYWYYGSMALFLVGGEDWTAWRGALVDALVGEQRKDTTPCEYAGSWDATTVWGPDGGRTYTTAMAVLCLQTENRFPRLPGGRTDLLDALAEVSLEAPVRVRLLRAVSVYEVDGASKAARALAKHEESAVRAAVADVLGGCASDGKVVKELGRLLGDDDIDVRRAAAVSLRRLGRQAARSVPALVKALDDADEDVRVSALRALGEMGSSAAPGLDRARALLTDPWPRVRVAAAGVVWRVGEDAEAAEPVLVTALSAKNNRARADAARALASAGASSAATRAALARALDDEVLSVRVEAALGLEGLGHDVGPLVDVAASCLEDGDLDVQRRALALVARLGPPAGAAASEVIPLALDGPRDIRVAAARAIGRLGIGAEGGVAALIACRWRAPPVVRETAAASLASLGKDDEALVRSLLNSLFAADTRLGYAAVVGLVERGKPAVPPLLQLLREKKGRDRRIVLYALSRLGPVAAAAVPQAIALLDVSDEPALQAWAAHFLGQTGRHAADAVAPLEGLVASEASDVQEEALRALGRIGQEGEKGAVLALSRIAANAKADWRWRRGQALRILTSLGPAAEPALPALLQGMREKRHANARDASVQAVVAIGRPALKALKKGITDDDEVYRKSVFEAIGKIGEDAKKLVPDLVKAMHATQDAGIYPVARALSGIGKPAIRPLVRLLKDKESLTRTAAAWALGLMGKKATSAIRPLEKLLDDEVDGVREQARVALNRIRG